MKNMYIAMQSILDRTVDNKKVFGASFALRKGDFRWSGVSGNMKESRPFFIASTTKLFTTALILQLRSQLKLSFDDPLDRFLDGNILDALHIYKGNDYSKQLTIGHLLAHTSGLPDYFLGKGKDGESLEKRLFAGRDLSFSFEDILERTKMMDALFVPGTKGKAHYSDTNFHLLAKIIENITGRSFFENCDSRIIRPSGLTDTYLYEDITDDRPMQLYYKDGVLNIPKAMASFKADGGMVSTSLDLIRFCEQFFTGKLFPYDYIGELQRWNRIFYPFSSGIGIQLFSLPRILDPTKTIPDFIGHSGLSGALAFYCPREDLYIAGTVNQMAHPDISIRTMIKLSRIVLKD